MTQKNFVKTTDASVAAILMTSGYTCLEEKDGMWCFINNGKMNFSEEENKKMVYTNVLCI